MSGLLMPILAIGGIVVLGDYLTKKNKKDDITSSSSKSTKRSSSSQGKTKKRRKTKSKEPKTESILKVNKSKKKTSDSSSKRKLYVFYKIGSKKSKKWRYHKLPKGWALKKKNKIVNSNYSKEVVFEGPKSERDAMNKYLEKAFGYLKKNDYIKNYKISKEPI